MTRFNPLLRYGIAIALVIVALGLTSIFRPLLGGTLLLFFFPAVILSAWLGGMGAGLIATLLTVVAANYYLFPPYFAFSLNLSAVVSLIIFSGIVTLINWITTSERVAREAVTRQREELQHRQEQLQVTLASIGDAVIATDNQERITFMNPVAEQLTGWTAIDAIQRPLSEVFRIINEDSRQIVENPVTRVLRDGKIVGLANHTLLIRRDGHETPIDDSGAPIRDANGSIQGVILVFRDITAQRRTERDQRVLSDIGMALVSALSVQERLENLSEFLVPSLGDMCIIFLLEPDNVTLRLATIACTDRGLRQQIIDNRRRYPLTMQQTQSPHIKALQNGEIVLIERIQPEQIASGVEGDIRTVLSQAGMHSSFTVPLIARGRKLGTISVVSFRPTRTYTKDDLPLAEELQRRVALSIDNAMLYDEAKEAVHAREEFLSVAAHELKTPVTSLQGYSQLVLRRLRKGELPDAERVTQAMSNIEKQAQKLSRLVVNLLDITRIYNAQLMLERQLVDLVPILNNVVELVRNGTDRHTFPINMPPTLELTVDPLRMEQVFTNLLDNAVKYSPNGGEVRIDVTVGEDDVEIAITDNGVGVPPDQRDKLFDRFYRAQNDRYFQGLGLGLYISHEIIVLHGGELSAEFPEQGGTRMIVRVPKDETKN
jgi:PAS domain S-box-containing protein